MEPLITIFGLDDDDAMLLLIERIFQNYRIRNYRLFEDEEEFFAAFDGNVHIAIIDHFIHGQPRGFEIMHKIFEHNKTRGCIIKCRVIALSGQRDHDIVDYYLNEGARGYIWKDDKRFEEKFIRYISRNIEEITDILSYVNQLTEKLLTQKEK